MTVTELKTFFLFLVMALSFAFSIIGEESTASDACHDLAHQALIDKNDALALRCLELGLILDVSHKNCRLLKAKIEKSIAITPTACADVQAQCEAICAAGKANPNLIVRALGYRITLDFRPKDMEAAVNLVSCVNEGVPGGFREAIDDLKSGRVVKQVKRKEVDAALANLVGTKALSLLKQDKGSASAKNLVLAALALDPNCVPALQAEAAIKYGMDLKDVAAVDVPEADIAEAALKKAGSFKKDPLKQKLLVRIAEAVAGTHDDVILAVAEIEAGGTFEVLAELAARVSGLSINLAMVGDATHKSAAEIASQQAQDPKADDEEAFSKPTSEFEAVNPPCEYLKAATKQAQDFSSLDATGLLLRSSDTKVYFTNSGIQTSINDTEWDCAIKFKIQSVLEGSETSSFGLSFGVQENYGFNAYIARRGGDHFMILARSRDGKTEFINYKMLPKNFDYLGSHTLRVGVRNMRVIVTLDDTKYISCKIDHLVAGNVGFYRSTLNVKISKCAIKIAK